MEVIKTGGLKRLQYERTESTAVTDLFYGIYGVGGSWHSDSTFVQRWILKCVQGRQTAYKWFVHGCRTLEDLARQKNGVRLNEVQEIGLKYYSGWCPPSIGLETKFTIGLHRHQHSHST